jgi:KDO2-lipid IV(A) lauroyltransferase
VEGEQTLRDALAGGRGCIAFSGHLGNWEIMASIFARLGLPVSVVVTSQRNKRVEQLIDDIRRSTGIEIIKRRDAVRGVLSALKRNRVVAILIDQDAHEDGAFVPFFGKSTSTPRGPAVFHLRTGAPLVFAHSVRLPGERYRIQVTNVDTTDLDDADELTARMTAQLEAAIRETPEQWTWMHKRWKTRPPAS